MSKIKTAAKALKPGRIFFTTLVLASIFAGYVYTSSVKQTAYEKGRIEGINLTKAMLLPESK